LHGASPRGQTIERSDEPSAREAWQEFSAVAPLEKGDPAPPPAWTTIVGRDLVSNVDGEVSHHGMSEMRMPVARNLADASAPHADGAPQKTNLVLPWQQADKKWFMQLVPLATTAVGVMAGASAAQKADPSERIERALSAGLPWVVGATALVDGIVQLMPYDKRAASQNYRLASSNRLWEAAPSLAVGVSSVAAGLVQRLARPSEDVSRQLTNAQLALASVYLLFNAVHSIQLWTATGALKRKTAIVSSVRRIITLIALLGVVLLVARRDCASKTGVSSMFSNGN
jgi:hypothetical protein